MLEPVPEPPFEWTAQSVLRVIRSESARLKLTFVDEAHEREYATLAFSTHRDYVCLTLLALGVGELIAVIVGATGAYDDRINGIGLRVAVGVLSIALSVLMYSFQNLQSRLALCIWLLVVTFAGLMPTLIDRQKGDLNESGQLLIVYLSAYSVFVPAFPVHVVSAAMWALAGVQALLVLTSSSGAENRINLTLRELFKGAVLPNPTSHPAEHTSYPPTGYPPNTPPNT